MIRFSPIEAAVSEAWRIYCDSPNHSQDTDAFRAWLVERRPYLYAALANDPALPRILELVVSRSSGSRQQAG
ncbi:MAG: hypothetical protein AAF493_28325 [Pseudomonadota bacterium]